jgi:hypothetical protein
MYFLFLSLPGFLTCTWSIELYLQFNPNKNLIFWKVAAQKKIYWTKVREKTLLYTWKDCGYFPEVKSDIGWGKDEKSKWPFRMEKIWTKVL